ncbi:hypothetical protein [Colwellia sp. RSH04]|uniref:hypothetical protein n=1 Tax=Colwellia sp. RSH04 TaxID=2305464 RepID=UPI0015FA7B7D|nr:hypothetical protein [Colwellia sp. RSH04]
MTLRTKSIAKQLDPATNALIRDGKAKRIFLESSYSIQKFEQWLTMRKSWK